eukprot:2027360-Amphidinium_carterae.1
MSEFAHSGPAPATNAFCEHKSLSDCLNPFFPNSAGSVWSLAIATFPELPRSLPASVTSCSFDLGMLLPQPAPAAGAQTHAVPGPVFASLKCITINVRSLNEAGKIKFAAEQALLLHADVVFLQETRLAQDTADMKVGEYTIVTSPALSTTGAHGGLAIFVKVDKNLQILSHRAVSHRVLVVFIRLGSTKACRLICAHAPIAESPSEDHDLFAKHISMALSGTQAGELVFLGIDLNARLGGLHTDFACVGEHAASVCPLRATHRHSCLAVLSAAKLVAVNTVVPHGDPMTWRHNSGSEHQIDFIFLSKHLVKEQRHMIVAPGEWSWFDCATTSDHRHVELTVMLSLTPHGPRVLCNKKKAYFVNDVHISDYRTAMLKETSPWSSTQDPRMFLQELLPRMLTTVQSTAPVRSSPRKPWMTDCTWHLLGVLNKWRRFLTAWHRGDLRHATRMLQLLGYPAFGPLLVLLSVEPSTPLVYQSIALHRVKLLVRQSRKAIRHDRRAWLDKCCADAADMRAPDASRILHAAVRTLAKAPNARGRQLAGDDGVVHVDPSVVHSMWHAHWGQHFRASPVPMHRFDDRLTMVEAPLSRSAADPFSVPQLEFDHVEVTKMLRSMPTRRATADLVPATAFTELAALLGPPLAELFNLCVRQCNIPLAYAGARLVPIWKRKGGALQQSSYRPVALLPLESKLFARLCLRKLESRLAYHSSQFGTGVRCGIEFPQVTIVQIAALGLSQQVPTATLFVDVTAAFDSVIQPILWGLGPSWCGSEQTLVDQGHDVITATSVAAFLHSHPTMLSRIGIPPSIVELLRMWGTNSWMLASAEQPSAWRPLAGVPQGHNLAALVFDIFYSEVMQEIDRQLLSSHCGILLPMVAGRSLQPMRAASDVLVGGVAFRDDLAIPIMDTDNKSLLLKLEKVAAIVASVHRQFHLDINWKPGKTEATLRLVPPSAKSLLAGLRRIGAAAGLRQPAVALDAVNTLAICDVYPHLGKLHSQFLRSGKETQKRLIKANAAFHDKAR